MFTAEQDTIIVMAHFRSGTRNPDGTWSYSLQSCIDQFNEYFPEANFTYDAFRQRKQVLVNRFLNKNCICKGKPTERPTALTAPVVEDIRNRIEQSPNKSVAKLSAATGLCFWMSIETRLNIPWLTSCYKNIQINS
ncbi:hypothetical protein RN001_001593 [Aquatica leii]|uniref:Uncharacterized protein n=1 Tax=Aquatica leii TaxID=1421715 RepID=A0AAN7Q7Y6_9COLE|nr:hypothetical protein RN001_001593 [Aquatica leii]